jgi:transglutaminase-like putative cysteine protease
MQPTDKSLNIDDIASRIPPSAADYILLAAALAVPLYTTSLTILQPLAGLFYAVLCWTGITVSYLVRSAGIKQQFVHGVGYILVVIAFLVISNLDILNDLMPGGGFPWQMAPASFMCWFLIGASFFLWTDSVMLFLLVPGIALFGVQSYIETAGNFAISMSLFMLSVAVLLTRLHLRTMRALAHVAGVSDGAHLFRGPWRAVAGPTLAVVSVIGISVASYFIAPGLGGAVRKLAGEPVIQFTPPGRAGITGLSGDAAKRIGNGPLTASNIPVLEVKGDLDSVYLRAEVYGSYVGTGFRNNRSTRGETQDLTATGEKSRLGTDTRVFDVDGSEDIVPVGMHHIQVRSLGRRHFNLYIPPGPIRRVEYPGPVTAYLDQLLYVSDSFAIGRSYAITTAAPNSDPNVIRAAPPADRRFNLSRNTGPFADRISDEVRRLAQAADMRGRTDYDDVIAIIGEIQSRVKYNLQAEAMAGVTVRVDSFIFDTQEGYCDLFAASLTVMCRAIGLRARLVSGYLAPPEEAKDGAIIVRDRHAHMWSEVHFEGLGWIPFDATLGAESVPGGEVGSVLALDDAGDGSGAALAAMIGAIIFGISFIALLVGAFWTRLKPWLGRRGADRKVAPYYASYLRALQPVLARPKHLSETTQEYALAYAAKVTHADDALFAAKLLDRAVYSESKLTPDEWLHLGTVISKIKQLSRKYARHKRAT